jgi:Fe-S cluster assembly iron-binding protein IscA
MTGAHIGSDGRKAIMLEITNRASEYLEEARSMHGIPPTYGVRVFTEPSPNGEQNGIQVRFTEKPAMGDEVVETHGTSLYVAPEVTDALADLVMDTAPGEDGPSLVFKAQFS